MKMEFEHAVSIASAIDKTKKPKIQSDYKFDDISLFKIHIDNYDYIRLLSAIKRLDRIKQTANIIISPIEHQNSKTTMHIPTTKAITHNERVIPKDTERDIFEKLKKAKMKKRQG